MPEIDTMTKAQVLSEMDNTPLWQSVNDGMGGTEVTCSCGFTFRIDSDDEHFHYVWAMRPDGTRSNLGVCPVEAGGWVEARSELASMGHLWPGAGVMYLGAVYGRGFRFRDRRGSIHDFN